MARRARSLQTLLNQVNAHAPNRDKASDGWIGDPAHAARTSDHNADGNGVVHAQDIDEDGFDCHRFVDQLVASKDRRLKYVIYEGRIWYPSSGWKKYTGTNAHKIHVHVSVYAGSGDEGHNWNIPMFGSSTTTPPKPTAPSTGAWNSGLSKAQIQQLQKVLNAWYPSAIKLKVDGDYGVNTTSAVRYAQIKLKLTADGKAGPVTRRALGLKF